MAVAQSMLVARIRKLNAPHRLQSNFADGREQANERDLDRERDDE